MASFGFRLGAEYDTSAGVYAVRPEGDVLVRTLWRSVRYGAGQHFETWDGRDDQGAPVSKGPFRVKVQCSDMSYVWDGVIGNTSDRFTGVVWQSSTGYGITDLAASDDGSAVYAAFGYNEGAFDVRAFATAAPQHPINIVRNSVFTAYALIAADGDRLYAANVGDVDHDAAHTTFVRALSVKDFKSAPLEGFGQSVEFSSERVAACVDIRTGGRWAAATGLAVQRGEGGLLAVAHGDSLQRVGLVAGDDEIAFFDKRTGAHVNTLKGSFFNPQRLAFDANGDLWAITSGQKGGRPNQVCCFAASSLESASARPALVIGNEHLTAPLNVSVSKDGRIYVADGSQEMVQIFSEDGSYVGCYGDAGGYRANGPEVNDHRFQFGESVPLLADDQSALWIGDGSPGRGGTGRLLHIGAKGETLNCIQFLTANSTVACDPNDPARVFWDFLEFKVDYSQSLAPGDPGSSGAWKLVRNWAAGLDPSFYPYRGSGYGLNTVVTLRKGDRVSTLALANTCRQPSINAVLQLPANGPARILGYTPQQYDPGLNYSLCANGDFRYAEPRDARGVQRVYARPLTWLGFDGTPAWGAAALIATTSQAKGDLATGTGFFGTSPRGLPISGGNVLVTFDSAQGPASSKGMRLGGTIVGRSGYAWRSSPTVAHDVPFDGKGSYDLGDGVSSFGGNKVMAIETDPAQHSIVYGYNGEFYNGDEANQFMHFTDNGLFVGQFGTPGKVENEAGPAIAGFAGNSFCPSLAKGPDGEIYLYHNDESNHAGIHRWRLAGASAIFTFDGSLKAGATIALRENDPAAPIDVRATGVSASSARISWKAVPSAVGYCVKTSACRGGPYRTDLVRQNSAAITATADAFTYVCVSAIDRAKREGPNSSEVRVRPQDPKTRVGFAGSLAYRHWDPDDPRHPPSAGFKVDSHAGEAGRFALTVPKSLDSLGELLRQSVGSRGCVIFGEKGRALSNLGGASISLSPEWTSQSLVANTMGVDGAEGRPFAVHAAASSYLDLRVSDETKWHFLTVFAPATRGENHAASLVLTPKGKSSPPATFTFADPSTDNQVDGFNRIVQFRFRGNVRLTFKRTDPEKGNANLQALFLDDAPEMGKE